MPRKQPERSPSPYNWMTSFQAADYVGVHVNFLRTIPAKELPFYLMGRNRRYKPVDLDAYIASRVVSK